MEPPVPVQTARPSSDEEIHLNGGEMVVLSSNNPNCTPSSPFVLPEGWMVEQRPRSSNAAEFRIDKYYYEPGTGRQFRSLKSVQKYLTEEKMLSPEILTPNEGNTTLMLQEAHYQTSRQIVVRSSSFKLPDDWIIEEQPRRNIKYSGVIDKYYIEPGTGQRFRSLVAVERYLTKLKENTATPSTYKPHNLLESAHSSNPRKNNIFDENCSLEVAKKQLVVSNEKTITRKALKSSNYSKPSNGFGSRTENVFCRKAKTSNLGSASAPAKVNWVLNVSGENLWSPFMDESAVPESVMRRWFETFILSVKDEIYDEPSF